MGDKCWIVRADRGEDPSIKEVKNNQDLSVSIFQAPVVVGGGMGGGR